MIFRGFELLSCEFASDQRLLNCGARRAAFRRRKLRIPRPAAGGRSRSLRCASSPHESRCACFRGDPFPIKYEVRSQSRKKAPSMRTALLVCNKPRDQRLLNCGARRAALRPYSSSIFAFSPVFTRLFELCLAVFPYELTHQFTDFSPLS